MITAAADTLLSKLLDFERNPAVPYPAKLDRARHLMKICGDPQFGFKTILIAGSKGKGSAAALIESALRASGLKTGLYTSPHLSTWRERVRVSGAPIEPDAADRLAARIDEILSQNELPHGMPTYFEAMTALAFLHFKDAGVDVAVLEVGLGGEYDATNVSDPDVSVIMPIGYEHQAILGWTLEEIAKAKSGVMRRGRPVVVARQPEEAMKEIRRRAKASGAEIFDVRTFVNVAEIEYDLRGQRFFLQAPWGVAGPLEIPLLGKHQIDNAAAAYAAIKLFSSRVYSIASAAIEKGFASAEWPGRIEILGKNPRIVIDGAHTAESARALKSALERHFTYRNVTAVVGMAQDKSPAAFAAELAGCASRFICTGLRNPRAMGVSELARRISEGAAQVPVDEAATLAEALELARASAGAEGLILVTGSLYLCAEAKELLQK